MYKNHPLNLNLQKVAICLDGVLSADELLKIKAELYRNVRQAIRLGEAHLRAARAASARGRGEWRQVVSRGYYCCYCASRAVRLAKSGIFSMETDDHKRIGDLPDSFPRRAIWADILTKLRADRNLADYDHSARTAQLEYNAEEYLNFAREFIVDVKRFLPNEAVI